MSGPLTGPTEYPRREKEAPLMADTIVKLVLTTEVPPNARPCGYVYIHDVELEGDENLKLGVRVEIRDEGGDYLSATVDDITR
jgi:hypothetical protein